MTAEEEAITKAVTAKLTGTFYIGQRVRFANAGDDGAYGSGVGSVEGFEDIYRGNAARVRFDGGCTVSIFCWALEPA